MVDHWPFRPSMHLRGMTLATPVREHQHSNLPRLPMDWSLSLVSKWTSGPAGSPCKYWASTCLVVIEFSLYDQWPCPEFRSQHYLFTWIGTTWQQVYTHLKETTYLNYLKTLAKVSTRFQMEWRTIWKTCSQVRITCSFTLTWFDRSVTHYGTLVYNVQPLKYINCQL